MLRTLAPLLIITWFLVGSHDAAGQTPATPDSALEAILSSIEGTNMSLSTAVEHALNNATSVRKAEAVYLAAAGSVRREAGFFDPELFFNLNYQDLEQPTASFFAGAPILTTTQTTSQGGLRLDLPIGTSLEASLSTISLRSNSQFAFLNPQHTAFGSLSIRQPLLGGFAASARKALTSAERGMQAMKARYDQEVLAIRSEVERSYWDLYAAERDYAVQALTRDRGEAFLKETELRAKAGLVGPNQTASARTFLAEQQLLLLEREEQLDRASDLLSSLIGARPPDGAERFVTIDEPPGDFPLEPADSLVKYALRNNLDLQAAREDVESLRALSHAAGWEALPSVDLVGSLGGSGLAGAAQDVIFGTDTLRSNRAGTFSDALRQVGKREFPAWSIGVEVSVPIGFRSGLGETDRLEAEVIYAEQRVLEQARSLEERVRTSYRELVHGKRRLQAAREGVEAAQEQVRIGLIEYRNGRTTAFELVRLGADFAVTQQRYSQALVRTAKAAATLRQLTSGVYGNAGN